jgi:hypothetical protein
MKPHRGEASFVRNAPDSPGERKLDAADNVAEHVADGWAQQS